MGLSVNDAKAKLITQLGDTQAFWQGAIGAATADVGGGSVAKLVGSDMAKAGLLKRAGTEAATIGGLGALQGGAADAAQQQAVQPATGKPIDWHEVMKQSLVSGIAGVGLGGVVGALARHAPETLAHGTPGQIASAEGQAVNHATIPDHANVPGAPHAGTG